nr:required for respiratory growth protein 9, mitochondrial [Quercus suber]
MLGCTCSFRTLEVFVEQVTGLNVGRLSRARTTVTNRKPLAAHLFTRPLQTTTARLADDAPTPLETSVAEAIPPDLPKIDAERAGVVRSNEVDNNWHARDIRKASTNEKNTSKISSPRAGPEFIDGSPNSSFEATVDAVHLPDLHSVISKVHPDKNLTLTIINARKQSAVGVSADLQRTHLRKLRKIQRIQEGKFRPRAQEVKKRKSAAGQAESPTVDKLSKQPIPAKRERTAVPMGISEKPSTQEEQVTSVLDLIEGLEGPEVKLEKRKQLNVANHKAAKKLKYDQMVADKAATKKKSLLAERTLQREPWQVQKAALRDKFGEVGWSPRKRLSPDTLEGIRAIHASDPGTYTTETLSAHFKITPEAIRRILKSKWKASEDETMDRRARWERRGIKKWEALADLGVKPPAKWRAMGVGSEKGIKPDSVPKRNLKRGGEGSSDELSWDEVVADIDHSGGVAARIL